MARLLPFLLFAGLGASATAADTTPPSFPGGNGARFDGQPTYGYSGVVSATSLAQGSVRVHWWGAYDDVGVRRYCVMRAVGEVPAGQTSAFSLVGCVTSDTTFVDSSAVSGELYSYAVYAEDFAGNAGPWGTSSGHDGWPRVVGAGYSRSITITAPTSVAPGATIDVRRQVTCTPACNFGHNDLHGTMDLDIPYLTDPRYTISAPGSYSATPFTSHDFTFTFTAPTFPGTLFFYPEAHFANVNGWNPVPADGFDQGLAHPWIAIVVTNGSPLDVAPAALPAAALGVPYQVTLSATGEGSAPYTFGVTHGGRLPDDVHLSTAGVLAGTPLQAGSFPFTVRVEEHGGSQATRAYVLTVTGTGSVDDYLAGHGLGPPNDNRVKVYTPAGLPSGVDFLAYGAAQWGVNIAGGDVDGGTSPEILSGPGPGTVFGPQVRGFTRAGAALGKVNFFAYGTLRYGVNVTGGGIDADAFDEIVTGPGPGDVFGPHVRGFDYDGSALAAIPKVSFYAYGTLKFGANVADGDVEDDGFFEILTGAGPGAIFGATVRGFDYDGVTLASIARINFNAFASGQYGVNAAGGDADGDGFHEIAAAPGPGPGPAWPAQFRGFDYDGNVLAALAGFDVTAFSTTYGGRVGLGDVSGDGAADLLAGAGRDPAADSTVEAYVYGGGMLSQLGGSFVPFPASRYGVNVASAALGY